MRSVDLLENYYHFRLTKSGIYLLHFGTSNLEQRDALKKFISWLGVGF